MPRISTVIAGFKSFRPPVVPSLVLLLFTLLFITLGTWQTKRAAEKESLEQQYQLAPDMSLKTAIERQQRFSRISVNGRYDSERHFLLDNQIRQGRVGVFVFTPFYSDEGNVILVNRGWLPLSPDRNILPAIDTPSDELTIRGILNHLPVPGKVLGSADKLDKNRWPQLITYMNLPDLSESLGQTLDNWVIQLSKEEPTGFEGREWKAVYLGPDRHRAYAFQWFALTAASIIMLFYLGFRNSSGTKK